MNSFHKFGRKTMLVLFTLVFLNVTVSAQETNDYSPIDIQLIKGEYANVIDTCRQILETDSLNAEIWYKLGLAYQNVLPDDKSFACFLKAAKYEPDNNLFNFMLARQYFNKGKFKAAEPIFQKLFEKDSLNWTTAYYLTSILMQKEKYDESLNIYNIFYRQDSSNYIYLDKIGFALLRKKEFEKSIEFYTKSLAINEKNVSALKNLSYLYASTQRFDTALYLLGSAIEIDPEDLDLYVRRAALNYSKNYTKNAMDDYLTLLSLGDSTLLYIKRTGIGYSNNLQPKEAIKYLELAFKKDTVDLEIAQLLAHNHEKLKNYELSEKYYLHLTKTLFPYLMQLNYTYMRYAEVLKKDERCNEAITILLRSQEFSKDMNIDMIVANIYDEKLNNIPKAIEYYQIFLDKYKSGSRKFSPDYIESIIKRNDYLKMKEAENKK